MKLSVSFKDLGNHKSVEKEMEHAVGKLNVLLKNYQPELVQLHAVFSKVPRKEEHALALNLNLPTGTLHATAQNGHLRACCKKAFSEIEAQVKKHQSRLRKDYEWKRKRPRERTSAEAFSEVVRSARVVGCASRDFRFATAAWSGVEVPAIAQ